MEPEDNGIYTFAPNNPRSNADRYLARHGIEDLFEKLVEKLVESTPDDPIAFMIAALDAL
uniref:Transposase n=1 Tax=Mesocestoides corti TaxID=53468 RepID=A0A5K3FDP8_MESCO